MNLCLECLFEYWLNTCKEVGKAEREHITESTEQRSEALGAMVRLSISPSILSSLPLLPAPFGLHFNAHFPHPLRLPEHETASLIS